MPRTKTKAMKAKESQMTIDLDADYPLISFDEIDSESREIAVRWGGESGMDWIGDKHKLASDIMNYARRMIDKQVTKPEVAKIEAIAFNSKITIDDKDGMISLIDKLPSGIVLVYVDFVLPNPHFKIYTIEDILDVVGSEDALAQFKNNQNKNT